MKGITIGIFVLLLFAALNTGNDPLGWEAQARIEHQTQLQVATIQANAELEAIRLEQAAAMERAQVRAALLQQFLQVLPITVAIICAAVLLGLLMHYRWKQQTSVNSTRSYSAGYLAAPQSLLPASSSPLLELAPTELQQLQQQAQATNHRMDVVKHQGHHMALLIDNVTGQVSAEREFLMREATIQRKNSSFAHNLS